MQVVEPADATDASPDGKDDVAEVRDAMQNARGDGVAHRMVVQEVGESDAPSYCHDRDD